MSGGKKRSGFQITSVTSDFKQATDQSARSSIVLSDLTVPPSTCSQQGSSSQPTTPSLKRKYGSQDASGQDAACPRFRVVRLAVGGGAGGRGKPYCRGRWTCTEFMEWQEGVGFRRVLDTMRHAHSLESLEMIGRDAGRGGVHSQGAAHLLSQPVETQDVSGAVLRSGTPSPTCNQSVSIRLLDWRQPEDEELDSRPWSPPGRPPVLPPPLQLERDAAGQVRTKVSGETNTCWRQHCPVCVSASTSRGCPSPSPVLPPLDPTCGPPGPRPPSAWIRPSSTGRRTPGNLPPLLLSCFQLRLLDMSS